MSRNHYDRFAHASFGFLLAFPLRELILRFSGVRRGVWSFWLPIGIILATSGFFEILESIVAEIIAPGKGVEWLGGQADVWDAQNDMLSALVGAFSMMTIVGLILSNFSYALILIFLVFHTIGAHYTYAKVPAGFWLKEWLHLNRNHYDRVIHFSFEFLLLYPMRELLTRSAHARERWGAWLAVAALAALSSFFEIIEAVIAQIVAPELGAAYLGTQGDIWDAQKDKACAFVGAVLAAILTMRSKHHARR